MRHDIFELLIVGLAAALIAAAVFAAVCRIDSRQSDVRIFEDAGCTTDEECCARYPQLDSTLCGS